MPDYKFVDTHAHLDGEEFKDDLPLVIQRAKDSGVGAIFLPGVDASSVASVMKACRQYPGYCYPMIGLQPEEVRADWRDVLAMMRKERGFVALHCHWRMRSRFLLEPRVRDGAACRFRGAGEMVGGDALAAHDSLPESSKRASAHLASL